MGYETDYNLVKVAYTGTEYDDGTANGMTKAYKVGTTTATKYWLGSRNYHYGLPIYFYFQGRYVSTLGNLGDVSIRYYHSGWDGDIVPSAIRPILTLKADVTSSSVESSTGAYVLG